MNMRDLIPWGRNDVSSPANVGGEPMSPFLSLHRRIPVGREVMEDKISAAFKNGLLTVTVPYAEGSRSAVKRIPINGRAH